MSGKPIHRPWPRFSFQDRRRPVGEGRKGVSNEPRSFRPEGWAIVLALLALLAGLGARSGQGASQISRWQLRIHPVGPWYVGDVLSWEVRPPGSGLPGDARVQIQVDPPSGPQWEATLAAWGIDQVQAAVVPWAWETDGEAPGVHVVTVRYRGQEVLRQRLYLFPSSLRPFSERGVAWAEWVTACCQVVYFTQTETQRDLPELLATTEAVYAEVTQRIGVQPGQRAVIVFLPRLLGQGGFLAGEMWVTYRDRGPLMEPVRQIVYHEMVHWVEGKGVKNWRPTMLVEGLAVYLSGGHYRPHEPLFRRAHAVLQWGRYQPLSVLGEDFYQHQHELSYIQAGALVAYMVERWGWERFWAFYTSLEAPEQGETQMQALSRQLEARFGQTLDALDRDLRAFLEQHPATPEDLEDVRVTVALYEALRAYQKAMDPDAYYGTAWLPQRKVMQPRGIVTDAIRSPNTALHQTAELLLQQASLAWLRGDYPEARRYVEEVETLVDAYRRGEAIPWERLPEARRFRRWVAWAWGCGGELQRLDVHADPPQAQVRPWWRAPELETWVLPTTDRSRACPAPSGEVTRQR